MISAADANTVTVLVFSWRWKYLMTIIAGTIMVMPPKNMYMNGMSRMAEMHPMTVLRIFTSSIDWAREAIMATEAVMSAFSSHKKRNIAADGNKLNG